VGAVFRRSVGAGGRHDGLVDESRVIPPETVPCARPVAWPSSASSSCVSTQLLRMLSATHIRPRRAFSSRAHCARSRERARQERHTRKIPLRKCVQLINQGEEPSTLARVAHSIARGAFRRADRQSARYMRNCREKVCSSATRARSTSKSWRRCAGN